MIRLRSCVVLLTLLAAPPSAGDDEARNDRSGLPAEFAMAGATISLERTECFGPCPIYRVAISGTGLVRFHGIDHVEAIGAHEDRIEVEAVQALLREFYRVRFGTALDEYRTGHWVAFDEHGRAREGLEFVSDGPNTIVTLTLGEFEKRVTLYHDVPPELERLAAEIDRAAGTASWIGGRSGAGGREPATTTDADERTP